MSAHPPMTETWRVEALSRLYRNVVIAELNSGSRLRRCLVPKHVVIPGTNKIDPLLNDYQKVNICKRSYQAHEAMLALILGRHLDLEKGEITMHMCNNPACREPSHLKVGTMTENMEYAVACKRIATGERNGHTTCPEQTPRGDTHYNNRLKGEDLRVALELMKKYDGDRGAPLAIAKYVGTTKYTIDNLKRKGRHLGPDVGDTDIELKFERWVPKAKKGPEPVWADRETVMRAIRQRFHDCPDHARFAMIGSLANEFGYCKTWIRRILERKEYPTIAEDIPVPTYFGIGSRRQKGTNNREASPDQSIDETKTKTLGGGGLK